MYKDKDPGIKDRFGKYYYAAVIAVLALPYTIIDLMIIISESDACLGESYILLKALTMKNYFVI